MAKDNSPREKSATAALIWTVGMADILIAAALIWKLCTMQSPFKATNSSMGNSASRVISQSIIPRLIIGAIQTGATTSTLAVAMMVSSYIGKDSSNAPTAFHYLTGPLYVLTLLYNLNLQRDNEGPAYPTPTHDFCVDGSHLDCTEMVLTDPVGSGGDTSKSFPTTVAKDTDVESHATLPSPLRVRGC
ncbi:hypothetical protein K438DRAFT_1753629 [Mycena galopus ATCC 62051]|nr:hypothetical protein K438DRAFT_1753629 [Mycena galopus ATCC 62051]